MWGIDGCPGLGSAGPAWRGLGAVKVLRRSSVTVTPAIAHCDHALRAQWPVALPHCRRGGMHASAECTQAAGPVSLVYRGKPVRTREG